MIGSRRRMPQRCVTFPVVGGGVHHHALHGSCTVVGVRGGIALRGSRRERPHRDHRDRAEAWWDRTAAPRWIVRPLDAIAVDLAGRHPGDESVPVMVRAILAGSRPTTRAAGIVDMIEQQQLHPGGVTRVDREIDTTAGQYRPKWRAAAFPDSCGWVQALRSPCISKRGGHVAGSG